MTGFLRITRLDLLTMKSQFALYLSLVLIVLMFGFMGSSVMLLGITGAWFVALMSSNIFAIQEKNNLDRLYGSVSVKLQDIVLGRYVFVFLNYFLSFLAVIILHSGFVLFQNKALETPDVLLGFSLSFLAFSTITGIQMPMYFKMGYTKAKVWSMVPFIAVMAFVAIPSFVPALSGIIELIQMKGDVLIVGGILLGLAIQFLSYQISVVVYRKRKRG
ncbi:ABC-2 transporter permease [Clostridium sp. Marseille-P2415]|uniref:ABC-2 transporter permease n=1 Tax=Clostridium sp. Marseille-P2415 TaxID=1805471 RepID=UPI000988687C|nr:ABC-2 transporter permease [Clostridium sp. Marseille-P2415]